MRIQEIGVWTLRVVEAVRNGSKHEDSAVELKSGWLDPPDAARRIAGRVNASGGVTIFVDRRYHEATGECRKSAVQGEAVLSTLIRSIQLREQRHR